MTQLGTYTTFDAPTKKQNEAFEFLQKKFNQIGGDVRRFNNHHEAGEYISFEIDYPEKIEFDDESERKDEWHNKADEIYNKYNEKFYNFL